MIHPASLHALVCPMNWGLGHATRCIPIIRELLDLGFRVTIAASGRALKLLQSEFPDLNTFELPGFSPEYSSGGNMTIKMFGLIPRFIYDLIAEKRYLSQLLKIQKFDLIISDNRYGIYHESCFNILVIHQIQIKAPVNLRWIEPLLLRINKWLISKFDQCWIPDIPGEDNLSGSLSHIKPLPPGTVFIGPLSRFPSDHENTHTLPNRVLAILSGPEPQRSIFEKKIITQLEGSTYETVIIQGKPEQQKSVYQKGHLKIISSSDSSELARLIRAASLIICRSGYSSIMDLSATGGKALFVPTPGQTEQEYLARLFHERGIAFWVNQDSLELEDNIPQAMTFPGFSSGVSNSLLRDQLTSIKALLTERM